MRILALVAGTNDPSNADTLADAFSEGVMSAGEAEVTKLYVKDLHLDHFVLEHYNPTYRDEEDFLKLKRLILEADGVLIASPIWNFSIPAHLKNAIDRMGSFALDTDTRSKGQLKGKPFFFLFTGGGPMPVWKGLMRFTTLHVPESIRYFGGTIAGFHYEPKCMTRGKFQLVVNNRPENLEKVRAKGKKFAMFVRNFQSTGKLPMWNRLMMWGYEKGKRVMGKL
jgi:NAD(P)H-dependent FMN reductase